MYLSFFSLSFTFTLWSVRIAKSTIWQVLSFFSFFFFVDGQTYNNKSVRLAEIRWSECISESRRSLYVSFSRPDSGWGIYHWFVRSNLNFLHSSQWITLPTHLCLVLYSFFANLLHSLMVWLIVSFLSLHIQHLMFCCILAILPLVWLVLMALFCATIKRDSVFLLKFPFLSHVHLFSFEMPLVSRFKRPDICLSSSFCLLVIYVLLIFVLSELFMVIMISLSQCFLCSLQVIVLMRQCCF